MELKKIAFRHALVILSKGGRIYLDPDEYKDHEPIYLDEKDRFVNIGYMDLVDFPHFEWYVEVDPAFEKTGDPDVAT